MGASIDLSHKRFGKLTVLRRSDTSKNDQIYWDVLCDCGQVKAIAGVSLREGKSKSCGCGQATSTHGLCHSKEYRVWTGIKCSAKRRGIEFSLTVADIVLPEYCPILGIKLEYNNTAIGKNSPSCDRIDNDKGYIPGNVRIVSHRVNALKNSLTVEEVEKLLAYMRKH